MGEGGYLKIYNATPIDFLRTEEGSYQMNSWEFSDRLGAISGQRFYIEFNEDPFKTVTDDGGYAGFQLANAYQTLRLGASAADERGNLRLQLTFKSGWTDVAKGGPLAPPLYIFWTTADQVWRLLSSEQRNIGWSHDGVVELKIVQVDHYCDSTATAWQIVSLIIGCEWNNPVLTQFLDRVNNLISNM